MLEQLIRVTDVILGISHFSYTVKVVTLIFLTLFLGLILFFIFTLVTLITHQIMASRSRHRKKIFTDWIIQWMLEPSSPVPDTDLFGRQDLQESILDLVLVTRGFEKNILFNLYLEKGFWKEDTQNLKNLYWPKRLAALVRIDQWQVSPDFSLVGHLLDDSNFQIQQIAMKNAARTKDAVMASELMDRLTKINPHHSVIYECCMRLMKLHRELIFQALSDDTKMKLRPFILQVMGDVRDIGAVPFLIKYALPPENTHLRVKALTSLGKIGDPRGIAAFIQGLNSEHAKIRLASLRALAETDFERLKEFSETLLKDDDSLVKAWASYLLKVRA